MRNKIYVVLLPLYVAVVVFVLYLNGVFAGEITSASNLVINGVFMAVIGFLFLVSAFSFGRLNRCTAALKKTAEQMQKEYKEAGGKNIWSSYQDRKGAFSSEPLNNAFQKYRMRMQSYRTRRGYSNSCDIEEYINEDLLDKVGMTHFNSGMAGTLTGLGILGTFLGLALGLGSFQGNDIYTISDNVGPLLSGMKVAFHTSVYGIFFSIIFNFIYRSIMADAYAKLDDFLNVFRQCAQPAVASEDENVAAMLIYQTSMANTLKQMLELMKGTGKDQTEGIERIVNQFVEQMNLSLGGNFQKLGGTLREAADSQTALQAQCEKLTEAVAGIVKVSHVTQKNLEQMMQRQEEFAGELLAQREKLEMVCDDLGDEVGSQLYALEQVRNTYEK